MYVLYGLHVHTYIHTQHATPVPRGHPIHTMRLVLQAVDPHLVYIYVCKYISIHVDNYIYVCVCLCVVSTTLAPARSGRPGLWQEASVIRISA
ncbi:hypothetical protein L209DRAFT_129998 [Thermothelomyces heterothallicus CBS 203.75]